MHTLIYTHGGGRFGNQLVRLLHWMAWAREQHGQVEVLDLAFWPFSQFFCSWTNRRTCLYPIRSSGLDFISKSFDALPSRLRPTADKHFQHFVHSLGRHTPDWQAIALDDARGESIDLQNVGFAEKVRRAKVTTCSGWKIACWPLVEKYQVMLRSLLAPVSTRVDAASGYVRSLRSQYDLMVGLLIRQTDYRVWLNGRYFFQSEVYVKWIRQIRDLYPGRRVGVIVASDAWQDPGIFRGLPVHFASGSINGRGGWFDSFVELTMCDLVVSPPSTFGASAAFLGRVPLWPVVEAGQILSTSQILEDALMDASRHPEFSHSVK